MLRSFALAAAYRVPPQTSNPLVLVLAQNVMLHHELGRDDFIIYQVGSGPRVHMTQWPSGQ